MSSSTIYPYGTNGELPSSIGLVNDFITGGVDKALTAEQGKVLYESIFFIKKDLVLSDYTRNSYFINVSTIKWQETSTTYANKCLIIPIGDAVSIKIIMSGGRGWSALLSSNTVTIDSTPSLATGQNGVDVIENGNSIEYNNYTDAEYLYIMCNTSTGSDILGRYSIVFSYQSDGVVIKEDIVNDLVTGGADKALTAEQGKVLNDYIFGGHETTINLSVYTRLSYFINTSSVRWNSSSSSANGKCLIIPINDATSIKVTMSGGRGWAALLKSDSVVIGGSPDFATGQTGVDEIADGAFKEYSNFTDAEYLYIYCNSSSGTDILGRYSVVFCYHSQKYVVLVDDIVNDITTGGANKPLSAEQGKILGSNMYRFQQLFTRNITHYYAYIDADELWASGSSTTSSCVFIPCIAGDEYIFENTSLEKYGASRQVFIAVLSDTSIVIGDSPNYANGYTGRIILQNGEKISVIPQSDAVAFYVRVKNSSGDLDEPDVYHRINKTDEINKEVVAHNKQIVYTGSFVNKKNDITTGLPGDSDSQRAGMTTTVAVPYSGVRFDFKLPKNYVANIRHGIKAQSLNINSYWYRDGESFTLPKSSNYYRLIFAIQPVPNVSSYSDISAATVESLIESGDIEVTYEPISLDAIQRNTPSDCYTKAVIHKHTTSAESGIDKFPIFIHTSDNHGDAYRMQDAVEMAKVNNADAILFSGDIIANTINNGFDVLENVMVNSSIPSLYCRGNHETYGNSSTSFDVFSTYYSSLATKWSYLKASATVTDKTYYYMDFSSKSIRIIVLNPYEKNLTTNNAGAFSQDQIDWFITTLKSTPQGYGILCMMHSPEAYPSTTVSIEPISGKEDFFSEGVLYWTTPTGISCMPLRDIVDAFISRTTVSFTFTQTITGGSSETITVSGDFSSGVNTGVEFIAWVTGHTHQDFIGVYKNTTNRQVVLNLTCGICYYGPSDYAHLCNGSDLPRSSYDVTQDAMNVYAIDRTNKQIRIARIGSNCTYKLTKREAMIIDYVEQ